jgi:hypothetical protein
MVQRIGCTEVKSYSRHWPCLFPRHGAGEKHLRKIKLAKAHEQIPRLLVPVISAVQRVLDQFVGPKY